MDIKWLTNLFSKKDIVEGVKVEIKPEVTLPPQSAHEIFDEAVQAVLKDKMTNRLSHALLVYVHGEEAIADYESAVEYLRKFKTVEGRASMEALGYIKEHFPKAMIRRHYPEHLYGSQDVEPYWNLSKPTCTATELAEKIAEDELAKLNYIAPTFDKEEK